MESTNCRPHNYLCPFCQFLKGIEDNSTLLRKSDLVYENEDTVAFVSVKWWPNNPGHVLVIPKTHIENIYQMPDRLLAQIAVVTKQIALALKEVFKCQGVSTRQHNEAAGNQDVWHFHQHVFPRWPEDNLYALDGAFVSEDVRSQHAKKLREFLALSRQSKSDFK